MCAQREAVLFIRLRIAGERSEPAKCRKIIFKRILAQARTSHARLFKSAHKLSLRLNVGAHEHKIRFERENGLHVRRFYGADDFNRIVRNIALGYGVLGRANKLAAREQPRFGQRTIKRHNALRVLSVHFAPKRVGKRALRLRRRLGRAARKQKRAQRNHQKPLYHHGCSSKGAAHISSLRASSDLSKPARPTRSIAAPSRSRR
ncbi:hypothetical protein SDC9_166827 [bioreactor metagenome]|uniref:Uncharacterized protein n=1 Tax=bioreactor metagenome TaxID=1076179 RepID=A0A645FY33_9ZZZZ